MALGGTIRAGADLGQQVSEAWNARHLAARPTLGTAKAMDAGPTDPLITTQNIRVGYASRVGHGRLTPNHSLRENSATGVLRWLHCHMEPTCRMHGRVWRLANCKSQGFTDSTEFG